MIPLPRSRSNSVSSSSSEESEQDWSDNESTYLTPLNPQLDSNKRRNSSDSDYGSGSEPTSPLHSVPKAGRPPIPPKPSSFTEEANSSSPEPQTPPATTFDDTSIVDGKDPSTLPFKDRIAKFNKEASLC
ncbi:hypothetical protein [Wolbachia endosymbiont (group A) of Agelastica alni]|uniref:hypothetical protein n=1 Tax=Wolbachia endosymbiont (group A) of Agelastica alni TaxID=3066130 RepID=UPI003132FF71